MKKSGLCSLFFIAALSIMPSSKINAGDGGLSTSYIIVSSTPAEVVKEYAGCGGVPINSQSAYRLAYNIAILGGLDTTGRGYCRLRAVKGIDFIEGDSESSLHFAYLAGYLGLGDLAVTHSSYVAGTMARMFGEEDQSIPSPIDDFEFLSLEFREQERAEKSASMRDFFQNQTTESP